MLLQQQFLGNMLGNPGAAAGNVAQMQNPATLLFGNQMQQAFATAQPQQQQQQQQQQPDQQQQQIAALQQQLWAASNPAQPTAPNVLNLNPGVASAQQGPQQQPVANFAALNPQLLAFLIQIAATQQQQQLPQQQQQQQPQGAAAALMSPTTTWLTNPLSTSSSNTTVPTSNHSMMGSQHISSFSGSNNSNNNNHNSSTSSNVAMLPQQQQQLLHPNQSHEHNMTGRPAVILYINCDDDSLSEYQCLVRRQIELFEAGREEVESNAQGRNRPIVMGQVGIRCHHCTMLPPKHRARGAVYYPAKLHGE